MFSIYYDKRDSPADCCAVSIGSQSDYRSRVPSRSVSEKRKSRAGGTCAWPNRLTSSSLASSTPSGKHVNCTHLVRIVQCAIKK